LARKFLDIVYRTLKNNHIHPVKIKQLDILTRFERGGCWI
jgi:hypothetical protein